MEHSLFLIFWRTHLAKRIRGISSGFAELSSAKSAFHFPFMSSRTARIPPVFGQIRALQAKGLRKNKFAFWRESQRGRCPPGARARHGCWLSELQISMPLFRMSNKPDSKQQNVKFLRKP
jgi:hypothetical protein